MERQIWLPWCLLGCLLLIPACRWADKHSDEITAVTETSPTPPESWKPLTFVDRREFQQGTGPMDSGEAPKFSTTDTGLKYRILRKSDGEKPTAASTVTVNYRGWLSAGKVFDSSYERGEPTTFALNSVIEGWTEGMQLVGEGGMVELWVPSRLGYGAGGSPGSIPAHSDLHFIVELEDVK